METGKNEARDKVDAPKSLLLRSGGETATQTARREGGLPGGDAGCSRQSAKGVILDRAWRLRRQAEQLEELARSIPENFPLPADEALWQLVCDSHR